MVGPALEAVQGKEEGDYTSLHCKFSRDSRTYLPHGLRKSKSVPFIAADRRDQRDSGEGKGERKILKGGHVSLRRKRSHTLNGLDDTQPGSSRAQIRKQCGGGRGGAHKLLSFQIRDIANQICVLRC